MLVEKQTEQTDYENQIDIKVDKLRQVINAKSQLAMQEKLFETSRKRIRDQLVRD